MRAATRRWRMWGCYWISTFASGSPNVGVISTSRYGIVFVAAVLEAAQLTTLRAVAVPGPHIHHPQRACESERLHTVCGARVQRSPRRNGGFYWLHRWKGTAMRRVHRTYGSVGLTLSLHAPDQQHASHAPCGAGSNTAVSPCGSTIATVCVLDAEHRAAQPQLAAAPGTSSSVMGACCCTPQALWISNQSKNSTAAAIDL